MQVDIFSGLLSGFSVSLILLPIDKALQWSVVQKRHFLTRENFINPQVGCWAVVLQRSMQFAIWMSVDSIMKDTLTFIHSHQYRSLASGIISGTFHAIMINPISILRYHQFNYENMTIRQIQSKQVKIQGIGQARIGLMSTIIRDVIQGSVWSSIRQKRNTYSELKKSGLDFVAALLATTCSSPMNQVRNFQYKTLVGQNQVRIRDCMIDLLKDIQNHQGNTFKFIQKRLCLTAGVFRVAFGMTLSARIFDIIKSGCSKL